jgi:hypothetical protein
MIPALKNFVMLFKLTSFPRSAWECSRDALRPYDYDGTPRFNLVNLVPTLCVGMQQGRSASL